MVDVWLFIFCFYLFILFNLFFLSPLLCMTVGKALVVMLVVVVVVPVMVTVMVVAGKSVMVLSVTDWRGKHHRDAGTEITLVVVKGSAMLSDYSALCHKTAPIQ